MVPVVKLNALTGACDPGTFLYKAGVAWLAGAYRDLSPGSALVDPIAGTNLPLSARTCLQDCASPWLGAKFPTSTYAREPGAAVSVDRDFCALGIHGLFKNPWQNAGLVVGLNHFVRCATACFRWRFLEGLSFRLNPSLLLTPTFYIKSRIAQGFSL